LAIGHDAVWPGQELAYLQGRFPTIRIFPGIERSIGPVWSGQHLVVLGTNAFGRRRRAAADTFRENRNANRSRGKKSRGR